MWYFSLVMGVNTDKGCHSGSQCRFVAFIVDFQFYRNPLHYFNPVAR